MTTTAFQYWERKIEELEKRVKALEQENVRGKWILDDSVFGFPKWNCSKCKGEGRGDYLFCPNCGAEMRKNEE